MPSLYVSILVDMLHKKLPIFHLPICEKSTFFPTELNLHHLSIKVTKYAMINTKILCDGGVFGALVSSVFMAMGCI